MSDVLTRICDDKRAEVARRKRERPLSALEAAAHEAGPPRPFAARLAAAAVAGYGLVAEIKRASPSKGLIRADFDPSTLASAYEAGGAACLSVLTDTPYFQGMDDHLAAARAAAALPVLRKDFMLDPYQIVESRAIGADCILLIMAALGDGQAAELAAAARDRGMDILVEVHDEPELDRAARLGAGLLGINNRNLKTLTVDLATAERLAPLASAASHIVCESGLRTPADLARMARAGMRAFLIGESLMSHDDVEAATRTLLADPWPAETVKRARG